jgi:hypothetical protein
MTPWMKAMFVFKCFYAPPGTDNSRDLDTAYLYLHQGRL